MISLAIITISDRAAAGVYPDRSGPALEEAARACDWRVVQTCIVPDEIGPIQSAIRAAQEEGIRLILTTGGTGISPRDVTPEAIRGLMDFEIPGFGEMMRHESLKLTPFAILSRGLAAALGESLVIALPGKPEAAAQCLDFVAEAIPHALDLLRREPPVSDHQPPE